MARVPLSLRVKCLLVRHPVLANRRMGQLGFRRLERLSRRVAIRAARRAYTQVPFYHGLFEAHGFTRKRLQQLTWEDFKQLPDRDLLDTNRSSPAADALIGRSSDTSGGPVFWPAGWYEFLLARAACWR